MWHYILFLNSCAAGDPEVQSNLIIILLKSLKPLYLSLLLWILYCVLKKCKSSCLCCDAKLLSLIKKKKKNQSFVFVDLQVILSWSPRTWSSRLRRRWFSWWPQTIGAHWSYTKLQLLHEKKSPLVLWNKGSCIDLGVFPPLFK